MVDVMVGIIPLPVLAGNSTKPSHSGLVTSWQRCRCVGMRVRVTVVLYMPYSHPCTRCEQARLLARLGSGQ